MFGSRQLVMKSTDKEGTASPARIAGKVRIWIDQMHQARPVFGVLLMHGGVPDRITGTSGTSAGALHGIMFGREPDGHSHIIQQHVCCI